MGEFTDLDNPVMNFLNKVTNIFILSILWIICSIPIITIGPSTTAVYSVAIKNVNNNEGYLLKDFFTSFKENFKQSFIIDIILKLVAVIGILNVFIIFKSGKIETLFGMFLLGAQFLLLIELIFVSIYIFAIISRYNLKTKEAFKQAFIISHKHIMTTTLSIVLGIIMIISFLNPLAIMRIFMFTSLYIFLTSFLFLKIFKLYTPSSDK